MNKIKVTAVLVLVTVGGMWYFYPSEGAVDSVNGDINDTIVSGQEEPDSNNMEASVNDSITLEESTSQVMIAATFLNLKEPEQQVDPLAFFIQLDTHTLSLTDYPIAEKAELQVNGQIINAGFTWESESELAHHRQGTLKVPNQLSSGEPIWTDDSGNLTLILNDLDDKPEITFTW